MTPVLVALYIALFISFFVLFNGLKEYKELNYANPFFYFFVFIIFYFGVPSIFVEEINLYYGWSLSEAEMIFSNLFVLIILSVSTVMFYLFKRVSLKVESKVQVSIFIKLIWLAILCYLIYVFYIKLQSGMLMFSTSYTGTTDVYKLKNISYLLVTISILYFSDNKSFFVFIPNIFVAAFDLLDGSRTIALIALFPIFVCYAIYNKKTYLSLIVILFSMLIAVGVFRNTLATEQFDVPFYISVMGEFRETYILLPILIFNESFVSHGNFFDMTSSLLMPLLQPLRGELSSYFINSGVYAAELVGRGYGLGNNFLVESIYYGYAFIIVNIFLVFIYLYTLKSLIAKVDIVYAITIVSYSAIFIRLIVREGLISNVMMIVFILFVYSVPFLVVDKMFNKSCVMKKNAARVVK